MDLATLAIRITSTGAQRVNSELNSLERQAMYSEQAIQSLTKMMAGFKVLIATGLGVQGLNSVIQMADKMNTLKAQIRLATSSTQDYINAQKSLFDIAQQTRSSLEATTTLYVRTTRALKDYGYSQQEVLNFTETLNKAMAVGGVGAQEQASALFQLSQALGSGRLQGDEFRTIAETAPIILDVVAEYMGKSRAEVKALASEGQITSQLLFQAISGASSRIAKDFQKMPLTFGQAMQQMENATLGFVDKFSQTTGVFTTASEGISLLAKHFDSLALVLGSLAVGHFAKFAVAMTASTALKIRDANATLQMQRATVAQTTAELNLARVEMQSLAGQLRLAQTEQMRAVIRGQMQQQTLRITSLVNAETVAMARLTAAKQAASVAGRALSAGMSLLGGPAGVITIAASALFYFKEKAEEAREKALNLNAVTDQLKETYEGLSEASLRQKMFSQIDEMRNQANEIEKIRAQLITAQIDDSENPFAFVFNKSNEELKKLENDLNVVKEVADKQKQVFDNMAGAIATSMSKAGKSLNDIRQELKLFGVNESGINKIIDEIEHLKQEANDGRKAVLDLTGVVKKLTEQKEQEEVRTKILELRQQGQAKQAFVLASMYQLLEKKGADYANVLEAIATGNQKATDSALKTVKDSEKVLKELLEAKKLAEELFDTKEKNDKIERELKVSTRVSHAHGGSKTDYVKQYTDQLTAMQNQLAQLRANAQDIKLFGEVSQYQEVNKLTQDIATNAEKYKHYGEAGVQKLMDMAKQLDIANQQMAINKFSFSTAERLKEMEFELSLIGKIRQEQELLRYNHQLDLESARLKIGMSQENIAKLDEEIAKLRERRAEIEQQRIIAQSDPIAGMRDGFDKFGQQAENIMGNVSNITLNAFNGMSDALTDLVMTGKADFGSLAKSIIKDIIQMTIKMMIFKAMSSMFGGFSGGGATTNTNATYGMGTWYSGGLVGFDEGGFTGLGGKYTPAGIVHRGEYVLTKEATSRLGVDYLDWLNYGTRTKGFASGGSVGAPTVHNLPNMNGPNVSVNVINNGEPTQAKVETKQNGNNLEITVELMKVMRGIAKEEAGNAITNSFARSGGAFA